MGGNVNTCGRCGMYGVCTIERCPRCKMVRVAACPGCMRETGGMVREWQKARHSRYCANLPRERTDDHG